MSAKLIDETTGRYLPLIYPEEKPYWAGAKQRELRLQKCNGCSKVFYPIGAMCPFCMSKNFTWTKLSGRGTISNYVVFHKAWTKYLEAKVPYAVIQVELEEGPRLTTNLIGVPASAAKIGMKVEVDFEDVNEEITLVQFRPARS